MGDFPVFNFWGAYGGELPPDQPDANPPPRVRRITGGGLVVRIFIEIRTATKTPQTRGKRLFSRVFAVFVRQYWRQLAHNLRAIRYYVNLAPYVYICFGLLYVAVVIVKVRSKHKRRYISR